MWFIDRLDMHQDYEPGSLPLVGEDLCQRISLETGEVRKKTPSKKNLEGSYSTSLLVRCDGSRVSVEGNPSRWQRLDNLFGHTTFDACVAVYNHVLLSLGLPPFSRCARVWWHQGPEDKHPAMVSDGAVISRVDWTRNLAVGKGNVEKFLRGISTQTSLRSKMPNLYSNGRTVDWGAGSEYFYQKLYDKAFDMAEPKKLRKMRRMVLKGIITQDDLDYYQKVIAFCEEMGIVRDENEFKRRGLESRNLQFYGLMNEKDFEPYLNRLDTIMKRLEISAIDYVTISDQLISHNIVTSRQAANATQSVALAWLHGCAIDKSKSQYYVHRSRLLALGVDIAVPHDATRPLPQIKREREIHVSSALVPDWYETAKIPSLRAVA
jgi:hypothetical protein